MNKIRTFLPCVITALTVTFGLHAAPPNGLWTVNNNGFPLLLTITVDAVGNVGGFANNDPIKGFWNESVGRLMFHRDTAAPQSHPTRYRYLPGTCFPCDTKPMGGIRKPVLAGSFEAFTGTNASPTKNVFGWVAFKLTP